MPKSSEIEGLEPKPFWRTPESIRRWEAEYHPCENGVHVFQPEGGESGGITLKNFPGATLDLFRELSTAGDGDDFDLLADLFENGDLMDNVGIRRQDLAVIERALSARRPIGNSPAATKL